MKCEMNDSWLLLGVMPFCLLSRNIWEGNDAKGSVEITEQHYQIHACMTNLSMSDSQEEKARQSFEKKNAWNHFATVCSSSIFSGALFTIHNATHTSFIISQQHSSHDGMGKLRPCKPLRYAKNLHLSICVSKTLLKLELSQALLLCARKVKLVEKRVSPRIWRGNDSVLYLIPHLGTYQSTFSGLFLPIMRSDELSLFC